MKRRFKALLGAIAFRTALYRLFFRNKAIIALFHRVDDRYPHNDITCTRERFAAYCAFFSKYFVPVSLSEFLRKLKRGEDISRHVVITFDDGDLDNHDIAAVELRRFGLPACFFIATNFIGSKHVAWWDKEEGIASEWMSWDQVRSLRAQGFEVGAHTCNHVDLGVVVGDEANAEIVGSRRRLSEEAATTIDLFSYPYGRPDQITAENRVRVQRAGFACCVSAYGGTVGPDEDPFYLRRTSIIRWHLSPYQYGLEAMIDRRASAVSSM